MINHTSAVNAFSLENLQMVSQSFIHISGSNILSRIYNRGVSEDSDTLSHKNGSLLFLLCLIIGKLYEISKILMVRTHIDKVKSLTFRFHTKRSRNQQHF